MNHKRNVLIILLIGALMTTFGYLIDSDPPYPNIWHTVLEFFMMTFIFSGVLGSVYALINTILGWEKSVSKTKNKV